VFGPGRYTLSTENLPLLNTLIKIPFGGKSPFGADVWFVQIKSNLDVGWGTQSPISLKDPFYNVMIKITGYGQIGVRIDDPKRFLDELVGTVRDFSKVSLQEQFRGIVMQNFATSVGTTISKQKIEMLNLAAEYNALAKGISEAITPSFAQFGVKIINFAVESLALTPDTEKELSQRVNRMADIQQDAYEQEKLGYNYQQARSFDVLEKAAQNEGAGGAQANMMGVGMGLAMGANVGRLTGDLMTDAVAPKALVPRPCPKCGQPAAEGAKFCGKCGTELTAPAPPMTGRVACPHCQENIPTEAKFCPNCGKPSQITQCNCGIELTAGMKFCPNCGKNREG